MRINITAGECLNAILSRRYPGERFVPFNEAMVRGTCESALFSDAFFAQRTRALGVSAEEYKAKFAPFLAAMDAVAEYDEVVLWFGDEPFCRANRAFVLRALAEADYGGTVRLHIVDEYTGDILREETYGR